MRMGHEEWWCGRVGSGYSPCKGAADTPHLAQGSHEAPGRNHGRRGGARYSHNTHLRLGTLGRPTGQELAARERMYIVVWRRLVVRHSCKVAWRSNKRSPTDTAPSIRCPWPNTTRMRKAAYWRTAGLRS